MSYVKRIDRLSKDLGDAFVKYDPNSTDDDDVKSLEELFMSSLKEAYKIIEQAQVASLSSEKISDLVRRVSNLENDAMDYAYGDSNLYDFVTPACPNVVEDSVGLG